VNRQIRRLAAGLLVCYVILFVQLNVLQVGRQRELNDNVLNTRPTVLSFNRPRGEIIAADGVVAAMSVPTPAGSRFDYQRQYPTNDLLAQITGYYTFAFGSTQLERTQNDVLAGLTEEQQLRGLLTMFTNSDTSGDVVMTLDSRLQQVAKDALGDRVGSVVVIDPATGAIKAMWSYPSYDPNLIAVHDADAARAAIEFYNADPEKPLLANAYQERYMPGSTFKILTTAIGLQSGALTLDSTFPNESEWTPPLTDNPIENYRGEVCGGDLLEVFRRSCNIPFAQTAVNVGGEGMVNGTDAFGVGEPIPIDLPRPAASFFGDVEDFDRADPILAMRGFGQNEVQMVPLHMAMVTASVANGGVMMKPYVVDHTVAHDGARLGTTQPEVWKRPMTPETAFTLNALMQEVVNTGTASCCMQLDNGVQAAAKTGTAQLNNDGEPERSNAWITAFAPAGDPKYAIAVMIKGVNDEISASTGGRLAGPVAKQVLDFALANNI
jgi:peptidoglycan glycosyltransferase